MSTLSSLRLSWLSLLLALPALAVAGPYEVGSTSTAKGLKFKSNLQWKHSDGKDAWVLPKIGMGGPLNDHVELSIGTGYGVIDKTGGTMRGGLRDLSMGLKWRLLDEDGARPAVTIEPEVSVPTGDERAGTGSGAYAFELPVRVGRQFGALRLTGEASAARTFGRDADQIGAGVLLEYFGGPQWSAGVELVADSPRKDMDAWHLRANVGAKRKVGKHVEWQALAGRSVENRRGEATTTLKLVFEYKL